MEFLNRKNGDWLAIFQDRTQRELGGQKSAKEVLAEDFRMKSWMQAVMDRRKQKNMEWAYVQEWMRTG